ncbi:MAG: 3-hydroxyacyl-ACP dehydratase FabZ [Rickettsia endosymbiont of Sergentomyia squamirostris]|uniref:3-hydroxyacyl-[acyl-carrier-protein] dehydratase FabZ n=1 Tax=Candidatus Tisiphia endosymbiont of Sergentomyia squamirostris TaxID=3113639 RepID=A0AAT9G7L7_9RICK
MKINIIEIMEMLPHRYPFLLIDRVLEFKLHESIVGIKNVTFNEPQFTGHFPTKPVMPGVLIIEAMAQLSAILVAKSMDFKDKDVFFMTIEEAKFRKVVEPGDTLHIYAKIEQNRSSVWKFSSNSKVNDQIVAESKFTAMVKNRN